MASTVTNRGSIKALFGDEKLDKPITELCPVKKMPGRPEIRGWLTYDCLHLVNLTETVTRTKQTSDPILYHLGSDEDEEDIAAVVARIKSEFRPVTCTKLGVKYVRVAASDYVEVQVFYIPPPKPLEDRTVVYTNFGVPRRKYHPHCSDYPDAYLEIVTSNSFGHNDRLDMIDSPARRRVFCGKFPRKVSTSVIPSLLERGVIVVDAGVEYM